MEFKASESSPVESPVTDADKDNKKPKKKASVAEAPLNDRKQKAEKDIARSLERLALFEKPVLATDERSTKEAPAPTPETDSEELTDVEQQYVRQEIAKEHLRDRLETDPEAVVELDPAVEFLQRVENGEEVDTAYSEVAQEIGLETPESPEAAPAVLIDTSVEDEGEIDWHSSESTALPANGGSGGGFQPPRSRPSGGSFESPAPGPEEVAQVSSTVTAPAKANVAPVQRSNRGEFIVGGIVGYLVGRRHGRIKTEKKLLPIQHKLEQQVTTLERDIAAKEQQLTAAFVRQESTKRTETEQSTRTQASRVETRLNVQKPQRAERLGHMLVSAEAPAKVRTVTERPNNIREAFRPEAVKDMRRTELLELSEKILIEGASLRHIYDSHLIGEKQLRHLVGEYLAGKDIRKDLRKEMVEHEIDFERDPVLRDRIRSQGASSSGGAGGLDQMLKRAGALPTDEATDEYRRQAANDERAEQTRQQKRQQSKRLADSATVTAIVVMSIIIVILLVR